MKPKTDPFMASMVKAISDRRGSSGALLASEFRAHQWGVKLPHLMLEYLFGLNVLPHPSLIEMAGLPGSCKSAFLQYLLGMYAEYGFSSLLIETEGKMSSTLLESILGENVDLVSLIPGPLMQEEWQAELLQVLKLYRKHYATTLKDNKKTKGKTPIAAPLLIGLDSLGGSPSSDSMATVDKDGSAGRSFPIEALKNKRYFEQVPTRIRDLPLTLIYTNHEKPEGMGEAKAFGPPPPKERKTKGGITPAFFCGIRLFFEQASKPQKISNGLWQQNLLVEVGKNSFNQKGNKLFLTMEWEKTVDQETNEERQTTRFLWGKALAQFLAPSVPGFNYDRNAVKGFLTVTRSSDTKFSCKELDLENVSPEQMGNAIEARPDIVDKLRPYLGIKTLRVWDGTPLSEGVKVAEEVDLPDPDAEPVEDDTEN